MNQHAVKQIKKALSKNGDARFIDIYNGNPIRDNVCITLTTNSGNWGGCGSIAIIISKGEKR